MSSEASMFGIQSPVPIPDIDAPPLIPVGEFHLNKLMLLERDFYIKCQDKPRSYPLDLLVYPIATCYPKGIDLLNKHVLFITKFGQNGRDTFASIQQEVATIQAHESAGWLYVDKAASQRQAIMTLFTKLLKALREQDNLGLGDEFWGYRLYTYGLREK